MKRLARREESFFNWLVERWATKDPDTFWSDGDQRSWRWESWLVRFWPSKLTLSYWYWIFADLGDINWINLWSPLTDWAEFRYWVKTYILGQNNTYGRRFRWSLWEETKPERIICRFRGHPEGEVYYNPGGYEPDHRCKTCGEEIG